jgi:hypothetical protein
MQGFFEKSPRFCTIDCQLARSNGFGESTGIFIVFSFYRDGRFHANV